MCGRYTYKLTWQEIVALYRLTLDTPARNIQPRYNACPTTDVDVVVSIDGKRSVIPMRWGLVAAWWNKPPKESKLATFNARARGTARPTGCSRVTILT
jgi:putative SOS response-associated peptidase YedK